MWSILTLGFAIRATPIFLFHADQLLMARPEVTTPLTAHSPVREGLYFMRHGLDPYESDLLHQPPLVLAFFMPFEALGPTLRRMVISALFIAADFGTAFFLSKICSFATQQAEYVQDTLANLNRSRRTLKYKRVVKKTWSSSLLERGQLTSTMLTLHLMNPFAVIACCAFSFKSFHHLLVSGGFLFALRGNVSCTAVIWALAVHLDIQLLLLVPSLACLLWRAHYSEGGAAARAVVTWCGLFVGLSSLLALAAARWLGSWAFLEKAYAWEFSMSDLQPNVGIFWYLFMVIFERFWSYYKFLWHVHRLNYVAPIVFSFRTEPLLGAALIFQVLEILRAYPTLDGITFAALVLCVLHPEQFQRMRGFRIWAAFFLACSVMCAVMWHLWIDEMAGNANFFYFQSLGVAVSSVLFIAEFGRASMLVSRCVKRAEMVGQPAALVGDLTDTDSDCNQS